MFDSLGNLDRPVALVVLAPFLGFLGPLRQLGLMRGFRLGALGALVRSPRFPLFGLLGVADLRGFLRGAETLAKFSVLEARSAASTSS